MSKNNKGHFLLGAILGFAGGYGISKYVLPMVSKEDAVDKYNEVKDFVNEKLGNTVTSKENLKDDFNQKTNDLKESMESSKFDDNQTLVSDDNFEDIVLDESSLNLEDK